MMMRNPEIQIIVLDKSGLAELRKAQTLVAEEPPGSREPLYVAVFVQKKTGLELSAFFRVRAYSKDDSSTKVTYVVGNELALPFTVKLPLPQDTSLVPVKYITFADLFDPDLAQRFFITPEKAMEMMKMTVVFIRLDPDVSREMKLPEMIPLLDEDYRNFSQRSDGMLSVDLIIRGMNFVLDHDPNFEEAQIYRDFIVNVRLEEARGHLDDGKLSEAMETLHSALNVDSRNPGIHFFLGNIYFEREQFDKSIECYEEALGIDPGFREAYNNMGICLIAMDKLDEALATWMKSLKLPGGKDDPILLVNLGKAHIAAGDLDKAEKYLRKSIKLKPGNRFARNYLAVVLANTDRIAQAAKVWKGLLADGIYNPSVAVNLGRCMVAMNRPDEAYPLFFDVVFDDGTADAGVRRIAAQGLKDLTTMLQHEFGNIALTDVSRTKDFVLLAMLGHSIHIKGVKSLTAAQKRDLAELLGVLDNLDVNVTEIRVGDLPPEGETIFKYTELPLGGRISMSSLKAVGDLLQKRDILDQLLTGDGPGKQPDPRLQAPDEDSDQDDEEEGDEPIAEDKAKVLEKLMQVVKEEPDNEWAHYQLATALADAGRTGDALDHFNKAAAINPDNAIAHHAMGAVLTRMGRYPEAVKCFQHAIIATPDDELSKLYEKWNYRDSLAYFDLGEVYMRMEMLEESIEMFRKGLEIDARVPLAHFHLGLCYGMNGDYEKGEESFRNAILLDSEFGPAHTRLGITLYHQEKLDEAIEAFSRALELNGLDMEALFMLGQTYARKNNLAQAVECFRNVSKLARGSEIGRAAEARIGELMGGDE